MSYDQDALNVLNGVQAPDGRTARPWAWARVRARTVFGNLSKLKPFAWPNGSYAATVAMADHVVGATEQVSWRYVASDNHVYDLKDFTLLLLEEFIANHTTAELDALKAKAKQLRPWPADYPGAPDYER